MPAGENTFGLLLLVAAMAFLPIVAVTVTAFAKIAIVVFVVRNALGIQQLPPNIIVYGLSLILSVYIAMPVLDEAYRSVTEANLAYKSFSDWEEAARRAVMPLRRPRGSAKPRVLPLVTRRRRRRRQLCRHPRKSGDSRCACALRRSFATPAQGSTPTAAAAVACSGAKGCVTASRHRRRLAFGGMSASSRIVSSRVMACY